MTVEAVCYRLTRSIGFVRAQAWDVDAADPVATAQAAFMLNRQKKSSAKTRMGSSPR